jgi:predicted Zn-dependent peptidase
MTVALLTWVAAGSAAEEGKKVIIAMLIVGLIFIGVIALGELTHWAGARRKSRH